MEKQRHVLIIGGSRGIGAAAVRQFTAAGDKVVFTYHRSELEADDLRQQTGAVPVRCDVKFSNSVRIAVEKAMSVLDNRIDVLICNASVCDHTAVEDLEVARWEEIIDTDLNGVFYCIKYVLPQMIRRGSGCVITVTSRKGLEGAANEAAYCAAKAGVTGLTRALAREAGPAGIRVFCIAPDMTEGAANRPEETAEVMLQLASGDRSEAAVQVVGADGGSAD